MYEGQVLLAEDEKKGKNICQLHGCDKEIEGGNEKNKFCSRRHFYLDHPRRFGPSDQWMKAAMSAAAILAISEIDCAEAAGSDKEKDDGIFFNTMVVLVLFAAIGAYGIIQKILNIFEYLKSVFQSKDVVFEEKQVPVNQAFPVEIYATRSHGARTANVPVSEFNEIPALQNDMNPSDEPVTPSALWRPNKPNNTGLSDEKFLMIEKVRYVKVKDKIIQTDQTYDFQADKPRLKPAHVCQRGAFTHASAWDPKD